jgi:hypothetical protein
MLFAMGVGVDSVEVGVGVEEAVDAMETACRNKNISEIFSDGGKTLWSHLCFAQLGEVIRQGPRTKWVDSRIRCGDLQSFQLPNDNLWRDLPLPNLRIDVVRNFTIMLIPFACLGGQQSAS